MSRKFLVSGLITMECTLKVDSFPINYSPVSYPFFGTGITVSGVGYNIAKALTILGNNINFLSIIGRDIMSSVVNEELGKCGIRTNYIHNGMNETSSSIILYDQLGKRSIFCDLKDIQETVYPVEKFQSAAKDIDVAVMCTINYNRKYLKSIKETGVLVATDVHVISDPYDSYNADFMKAADILFMSNENLPCSPEDWVRMIADIYNNKIIVIGLGGEGALLYVRDDNFVGRYNAKTIRPVVNTIGAGDALFSSFLSEYVKSYDPYISLEKAIFFAGYKIGEKGAADGFLSSNELDSLYNSHM